MGHLSLAAGYVILYAALVWALAGHPSARTLAGAAALVLPVAATVVVIVRRRREWRGCQRLFWDAFGIGLALWIVGHIGWTADLVATGRASWLRWHTLFSLCGGIGPLVALLARPQLGVRAASTGASAILIASYALFAAFVYSYFVLIPAAVPQVGNPEGTLLRFVQVNRLLLVVGMIAGAWSARGTGWFRTYAVLAGGVTLGFFLRLPTSFAIARGSYESGTLLDLAWVVPFVTYLWAVLVAPASPREVETTEAPGCPVLVCAAPVFLVPLIGYGALALQPLGEPADAMRALLTGLMTVGGLALLTLRLSVQRDALQRADERAKLLAAAVEQTGDAVVITQPDGRFEHANAAFLRATGYSRAELLQMTSNDVTERGSETVGGQIFNEVRERGLWRGTLLRRRRDGTTFPAACTVVALRDTGGWITHLVGVERDVTEDLKLRDQLVHTERLSAIGALVGGVAHEINNPLQTILGTAELMLDDHEAGHRELELIRHEAGRAAQIVRNLLSFVRRSAPDRAEADLNEIVRTTLDLRQYHLERNNVNLVVVLSERALPVVVNREEIRQIVLNLILNAEHALESTGRGGTLSLRTFTLGEQHVLEVADDGPGISKELRGRIFEPFFTTKEVGQGTGLGLSISHGIALAHHGFLELCSDNGGGACFRLVLPASTPAGEAVGAARGAATA